MVASVTRSLTSAPVKVPLTCTAKFWARVAVTVIPGTLLQELEDVDAEVDRVLQPRHDSWVPGVAPEATPSGRRTAPIATAASHGKARFFMSDLPS
jgi:hypothetical protein